MHLAVSTTTTRSHQLCPTLSDPMDCSLPGSSIHGIFQARVLEWSAISGNEQLLNEGQFLPTPPGANYPFCAQSLSHVQLFVTLWTVPHQAPLSIESSRQEYWSGLPLPTLGDLPNPGIKPTSLASPALAGRFFSPNATWEALISPLLLVFSSAVLSDSL